VRKMLDYEKTRRKQKGRINNWIDKIVNWEWFLWKEKTSWCVH
jgi:hypothetical protein